MQRVTYLDRYFIRQPDATTAAYREEDTRLYGLPTGSEPSDSKAARPVIDSSLEVFDLQGFSFVNKAGHAVHESCDKLLSIQVKHGTWLAHTEQLLGAIMAQIDVVAPSDRAMTIKIGESDPEESAIAEYDSNDDSINFYAGKHGELLVNEQIAALLFPGEKPKDEGLNEFLQIAVAHECGHAFQKSLPVRRALGTLEVALRDMRASEPSCNNLRDYLSRASSTKYLEGMCDLWQATPEYSDFEFACEIWADIFAQTRLKRFDGQAQGGLKPLQAMITLAEAMTVEPHAPKPPEEVKEHFESLQGHIQQIRHQKISFPPFQRKPGL